MSASLAGLVLSPALTGAVLLLAGRRADRAAGPVAVVVTGVTVALAALVAVTRPRLSAPFLGIVEGGDLRLVVDGLSAVLVVLVTGIALLVTAFAVADLPTDAARARFFGYLLLFVAAMLATVTAATLPALLLAWEVMGATSYALIGFRWEEPGKLAAGTTAFVTTRAGDLGLYVAAGAALAATGSLGLADLNTSGGGWADLAAAGVLLAALGKSAQLPFSAWLSAAMQGPSPVSALLHSATMVAAGGYLLIRMQPLLAATGWAATAAAWIGALTALVLGAVAVAQSDLKQLLAASTAAQVGFVVLAAGVGATAGGTAQLVAHAAVKAGLFVAAGAWLTALGTKQLADLRGAARRYPGMGAAVAVAGLALAGIPPLSLWATKDEVLAGVDGTALHVVGLAAAAVSAVYAGRILVVVLARPAGEEAVDREEPGTRQIPTTTTAVAGVLAVFAAGLGVLAVSAVADAWKVALDADGEPSPGLGDLLLSGVLALVVLGLTVTVARVRPATVHWIQRSPLASWAGLRHVLSPRPALALARVMAAVDDRLIDRVVTSLATGAGRVARQAARADDGALDGAVTGLAWATRRAADGSARVDAGVVDGGVRATARIIHRAGRAARRPQTGLLHQYYVQAVVGLGFLLVLLLVVR
ncbi:proton-conducting transporter membrane subunit [Blastococcus saxobsidens]|uniref:NADH:ubiquinone oxidoreductase subunit 5 (Subunit L)/multisubunit Na+/H+ antiporter MnhA subunit n=1 Tax=Blastococcus saxobsidens TaxID=138336 RepID=A0A4V2G1W5_9ACTN|nr:proton-conducting transporter membrane subunit [Blastococcus saxobsidens]RZU30816.1 NADH:ubiquinone oxidoreductase subunit 5 (subunit L)/multisubunit Na+/H+ antiporter MnhA subunit [Blastococcus saxobsidens]